MHNLNIWRGDIRPDDNVWTGSVIRASFELCALEYPYFVDLKFHDCDSIRLQEFNHQNAVYDLKFKFEERGILRNDISLTPHILVSFKQAFGVGLTFKCFRVQAIERKEIEGMINSSE